jgi:hypothetical protein
MLDTGAFAAWFVLTRAPVKERCKFPIVRIRMSLVSTRASMYRSVLLYEMTLLGCNFNSRSCKRSDLGYFYAPTLGVSTRAPHKE